MLRTTFTNWDFPGFTQAYPGAYPGGSYPPFTGSSGKNGLGYKFNDSTQDTVYHIVLVFPHTSSTLNLDFSAGGLQNILDESWGLDNVEVRLLSDTSAYPYRYFLPEIEP